MNRIWLVEQDDKVDLIGECLSEAMVVAKFSRAHVRQRLVEA